jgi:hypothetical protein
MLYDDDSGGMFVATEVVGVQDGPKQPRMFCEAVRGWLSASVPDPGVQCTTVSILSTRPLLDEFIPAA